MSPASDRSNTDVKKRMPREEATKALDMVLPRSTPVPEPMAAPSCAAPASTKSDMNEGEGVAPIDAVGDADASGFHMRSSR